MENKKSGNYISGSQDVDSNFQGTKRTEDEPEEVSKSEKKELEKRKERTARGSTMPNKKRMS